MNEDENRRSLGRFVKRERLAKFKTVDRARAVADVSRGAWDNVEAGRKVKDFTLAAIEQALGHQPGLYDAVIAGARQLPGETYRMVPVGPSDEDAYVASPGELTEAGVSNDELLREIRTVRREQQALSERMAKLEQQGPESVGGTSGPV